MSEEFNEPQSRNEAILQNILGAENEIETPQSRNEAILQAILYDSEEIPEPYSAPPQSRIEQLLVDIYESGGVGGDSQIVSGVVNQNGTITFTDSDGNTFTTTGASVIGSQGAPGQDYVLTNQDKSDIADIVLGELPTTEGVLYGN